MLPERSTVGQALALARRLGVDRLDAQCLLAHVLARPRAWIIAHDDAGVPDGVALHELLQRRADGEPLAYLVGEREFHGLMLRVGPGVLVPRPDTETLVDWALELMAPADAPRVVDLGTGSGAIALALKAACPKAELHATDRSAVALERARENGRCLALPVQWHLGDWWQALPFECPGFDLAVANPPYVAAADPHLAALRHEPLDALVPRDDAGDGLADLERLIKGARTQLRPGGWLLLEHGFEQGSAVATRLRQAGYADVATRNDLGGRARVTGARLPAAG